ncbi:hypothetical protein [Stenotrophomonas maltophilia]|nr:hypothetical protein [Stenotrophomonas maltophilia]
MKSLLSGNQTYATSKSVGGRFAVVPLSVRIQLSGSVTFRD